MFKGSMVALVTPFLEGKVDIEQLHALVEFHVQSGTHAIIAAGTTGEAGTLSYEEKLEVIKTVIDAAKERIPVIAGTAANATKDCIQLTQAAMELGAHGALIMTPAYIKPTQEGLFAHYSAIAQAVAIPIILYNVPSRTACDMLPETIARLGKISNIVGVKEATGQMARLQQILRLCNNGIDVFSGDDPTAVSWMLAGAKGVISVSANVAAKQMAQLCELAADNETSACLRLHEDLIVLHELMSVESNPIPVKWALHRMGLIAAELRLPLTPLSEEFHASLEQVLQRLGII
jgi:4-hydroxy-tetrahydrodipicolinate synthase